MMTVFRYTLRKMLGQVAGWGLSLAILGGYLLTFYDVLIEQGSEIMRLIQGYPPELLAFFGDMSRMLTPGGFLHTELFSYMPLIVGFFSILTGSGLLAGDEETGTLDLVLAHPVSRMSFFAGRCLAMVAAHVGIVGLTWLGLAAGTNWSAIDVTLAELSLPCLSLLALLLLFAGLALFLSMVLPSRRLAAMIAGVVLVGSFFLTGLARINENLQAVARFLPLDYYQGGEAVGGLNLGWFLGMLGAAVVLTVLAALLFQRRDIRVGGEGSWGSWLPKKAPAQG
jgi:ABC-2 type transport system permease protein